MFTLTSNLAEVEARLDDLTLRQMPFAISRTLNDTAKDVVKAQVVEMQHVFDRPTPFTLNAFRVIPSTKTNLTAVVTTKDRQSTYLPLQAEGGVDVPLKIALLIPVHAALNQYGNMTKGFVRYLLGRPDVFVARQRVAKTAHLVPGIYQRQEGAAPILLIKFESSKPVAPRYPFKSVAEATAWAVLPGHFAQRMAEAMATAR